MRLIGVTIVMYCTELNGVCMVAETLGRLSKRVKGDKMEGRIVVTF